MIIGSRQSNYRNVVLTVLVSRKPVATGTFESGAHGYRMSKRISLYMSIDICLYACIRCVSMHMFACISAHTCLCACLYIGTAQHAAQLVCVDMCVGMRIDVLGMRHPPLQRPLRPNRVANILFIQSLFIVYQRQECCATFLLGCGALG